MNSKEREQQLKDWNDRNKHVLAMQVKAHRIVHNLIQLKYKKADVVLLGELILDLAKRMDG